MSKKKDQAIMSSLHLVDYSPWPVLISFNVISLFILGPSLVPGLLLTLILFQWFRDIIRESKMGHHTIKVQHGIVLGFLLFIVSEIMIFFSLFWAYFHSSLIPTPQISLVWPPLGIESVDYLSIPFLGSILLLSSGFTVTLSHFAFLQGNKVLTLGSGIITVILGSLFVFFQYLEYKYGTFTMADSVYGSVFYATTGLHGIHVILGVVFLIIQYIRIYLDHLTIEHHLGFEFSLWYYHLVDVIWILVFMIYYYWGS